jgi:hypothetical protein
MTKQVGAFLLGAALVFSAAALISGFVTAHYIARYQSCPTDEAALASRKQNGH